MNFIKTKIQNLLQTTTLQYVLQILETETYSIKFTLHREEKSLTTIIFNIGILLYRTIQVRRQISFNEHSNKKPA